MSSELLDKDKILKSLTSLFNSLDNVEIAVLFGSTAKKGISIHDIDIGVRLSESSENKLLTLGEITSKIASALKVNEYKVDVVDLDDAPPYMLWSILNDSTLVKGSERSLNELYEKAAYAADQAIELKTWAGLDPEPKVSKAILESRASEIRRNMDFLRREIMATKPGELSYKDTLALERAMHRVTESMLDICRHLVSAHSLGLAESYGDYPLRLAKEGLMPKDLATDVRKMAGLRNILVHGYLEVKLELLYEAMERMVKDIAERFLEWVKGIDPP
jgi:uncharacterized protein YutE (UPF0331/DUF86 family)/predicted nucleotidyltransferase